MRPIPEELVGLISGKIVAPLLAVCLRADFARFGSLRVRFRRFVRRGS